MRQIVADRTGWTLDYVDTLAMADVMELLAFWDGKNKAQPKGGHA